MAETNSVIVFIDGTRLALTDNVVDVEQRLKAAARWPWSRRVPLVSVYPTDVPAGDIVVNADHIRELHQRPPDVSDPDQWGVP